MKLDKLVVLGKLTTGKLEINREYLSSKLAEFEDCSVRVIVERIKSQKTLKQLGYFFGGVLPPISAYTGDTVEELYYNVFRPMFAPKYIKFWRDKEIVMTKGLSEMSTGDAKEFIDKVIMEAASMGVVIQTPKEYYEEHYGITMDDEEALKKVYSEPVVMPEF